MTSDTNHRMVSIVSPIHNEERGIGEFVERTSDVLESLGYPYEIILIDDGSVDNSWSEIGRLHTEDIRVRGIRLSRNFGKEAAILSGLEAARGEAAVVIDSDLQHPPEILPKLLEHWRSGADVVEAVKRNRTGQTIGVRIGARVFNKSFERMTGVNLTGATDYRLLSRKAITALLRLGERTYFFRGTSTWIGFNREQVYFDVAPRVQGSSRWGFGSLLRLATNGITSFTPAPLHLVTVASAAFAGFAVVLGIQTAVRFLQGDAVTGFTTVILLLLIQGTILLLGIGIVGEYLARIHDEVKQRPRFLVSESLPREPSGGSWSEIGN